MGLSFKVGINERFGLFVLLPLTLTVKCTLRCPQCLATVSIEVYLQYTTIMSSSTSFEAAAATAAAATGVAMPHAGFTSSGIAAGSIAAGIQSAIGNVAAGSSFAALQSFGAVGGFAGLAVAGIGYLMLSFFSLWW